MYKNTIQREEKEMINIIKMRISICVERDEHSFYAYCPNLKGVHVEGNTEHEAVNNASDAAIAYIESMMVNKEPLPLCVEKYSLNQAFKYFLEKIFKRKTTFIQDLDLNLAH